MGGLDEILDRFDRFNEAIAGGADPHRIPLRYLTGEIPGPGRARDFGMTVCTQSRCVRLTAGAEGLGDSDILCINHARRGRST